MPSNWRKVVVVISLMIVIVVALTPDACADDYAPFTSSSNTLCKPHTSERPFGCQHEEDCFCCAHIVPLGVFEFCPFIGIARAEQQQHSSALERVPSAPYHPPRA